MVQKIEQRYGISEALAKQVKEARKMIAEWGWEDRTVMPWERVTLKVTDILKDMDDYDRCTKGSQEYLIGLWNGLAEILNKWEEEERKHHIMVRIISSGKVIRIKEEDEDIFEGLIERV